MGEADLVCFVGSETGGMTTHFWQVPPIGTPAVQIDIEPQSLGRNYPLKAAVCADAKMALDWMLDHADPGSAERRTAWAARARQIVAEWHDRYRPLLESDAVPIRPERICHELTRHLPEDGHRPGRHGSLGHVDGRHVRPALRPGRATFGAPAISDWAFPAGLGAKCAAPERPVFVFTGDAGFWYHLSEIETAVRCGINTVTLVNNNSSGNQGAPGFDRAYGGKQSEQGRELWTYKRRQLRDHRRGQWGRWACASRTPPTYPVPSKRRSPPTVRR